MWTGADPSPRATSNARALEAELQWLDHVLQLRLAGHFGQDGAPASPHAAADRGELPLPPPLPATPDDDLTRLIREGGLGPAERLVLALALAPHLRPQLMDLLFVSNRNLDRGFCEFGGWKGRHHGGFLPTVETAAFLLAGEDLSRRFALRQMLDETAPLRRRPDHRLVTSQIRVHRRSQQPQLKHDEYQHHAEDAIDNRQPLLACENPLHTVLLSIPVA